MADYIFTDKKGVFKMLNNITDRAYYFAKYVHRGQLDDTGKDYFKAHIEQVVKIVKLITNNQDIIAAAYLHDTIEDAGVTLIDLTERFNKNVARMVYELTKEGKKDQGGYYFPRLKSRDAILIKFADRLSNLSRMEAWDEKRQNQYIKKSRFWKSDPSENV